MAVINTLWIDIEHTEVEAPHCAWSTNLADHTANMNHITEMVHSAKVGKGRRQTNLSVRVSSDITVIYRQNPKKVFTMPKIFHSLPTQSHHRVSGHLGDVSQFPLSPHSAISQVKFESVSLL
jgi:hypothetical protein